MEKHSYTSMKEHYQLQYISPLSFSPTQEEKLTSNPRQPSNNQNHDHHQARPSLNGYSNAYSQSEPRSQPQQASTQASNNAPATSTNTLKLLAIELELHCVRTRLHLERQSPPASQEARIENSLLQCKQILEGAIGDLADPQNNGANVNGNGLWNRNSGATNPAEMCVGEGTSSAVLSARQTKRGSVDEGENRERKYRERASVADRIANWRNWSKRS